MQAQYIGRPAGMVPKNLSISRHACELLEEMAPARRGQGAFITALIEKEYALRQERQRVRAERVQGASETALEPVGAQTRESD